MMILGNCIARSARTAVVALACLLSSGCASLRPTQEMSEAIVRIGTDINTSIPVAGVASYFAPYVILAQATYYGGLYNFPENAAFPDNLDGLEALIQTVAAERPERKDLQALDVEKVRGWASQWRLIDQRINESERVVPPRHDFTCISAKPGQPEPLRSGVIKLRAQADCDKLRVLDGLGIQVWVRKSDPCAEIVIAFRGTDFAQADDWLSNLRWVTRVLPYYDQYEQVHDHLHDIIANAKRIACGSRLPGRIVAVGHSLGGGLAQHAGYVHPQIDRVYAFDPSFVTGYYDDQIINAKANAKLLKIDRIYEHGEVLAYPRLLLRHLYTPAPCDPLIRHVRVQAIENWSPIDQHRIALLTGHFLVNSPDKPPPGVQREVNLPPSPQAIGDTAACRMPAHAIGYVAASDQPIPQPWMHTPQMFVTFSSR
jgi:pimeloyl-ACP methyl ester carboxylesterase